MKSFRHDSNLRNSSAILRLRMALGAAGYGIYFMLRERLCLEPENKSPRDYEMLAFDFNVDPELIRATVEDFNLFELTDDGSFRFCAEQKPRKNPEPTAAEPQPEPEPEPEQTAKSSDEEQLDRLTDELINNSNLYSLADDLKITEDELIAHLRGPYRKYRLNNPPQPEDISELRLDVKNSMPSFKHQRL